MDRRRPEAIDWNKPLSKRALWVIAAIIPALFTLLAFDAGALQGVVVWGSVTGVLAFIAFKAPGARPQASERRATGLQSAAPAPVPRNPAPIETDDSSGLKTCPDCAEQVRVAARRCRYCSYQFAGA